MESAYQALRTLHIVGVVFMSAPLYSLIISNERALLGASMVYSVDRYMENLIKRSAVRCYVFQFTVLATGIGLVLLAGHGLAPILENGVLGAKTAILLLLIGLLSIVHFRIQPGIERELGKVKGDPIPEDSAKIIRKFRMGRKRLAAACLFLVLATIVLGLQIHTRYAPWLTAALLALAAAFSWRVYKSPIKFGWI